MIEKPDYSRIHKEFYNRDGNISKDYLLGKLSEDEESIYMAHTLECSDCRVDLKLCYRMISAFSKNAKIVGTAQKKFKEFGDLEKTIAELNQKEVKGEIGNFPDTNFVKGVITESRKREIQEN